ncbi:MAG: MBL fold metallo-hydrolase [Oscillospiraceae bacterium]|nr:MBL fold metallo-hydrolase [Oscillospiraceae bacterium]
MPKHITDSVVYTGANDREIDLFEGQYAVPEGMSYNSYVILDGAIAVMDTIDRRKTGQWLQNLEDALAGKTPDYLVVQHMEPDHSASIAAFVEKYPEATVVGNAKTFAMIGQFFPSLEVKKQLVVKDGDALELGSHTLHFVFAPMVHWPEVMMTYESSEKILFSADAFGRFGALDAGGEWADEARRYYIGIVGKYGPQVQAVLKKAAALDIRLICPLHGPALSGDLAPYLSLYDAWSAYRPEKQGVCLCYTSIYGNTKKAVEELTGALRQRGVAVAAHDLARCDMSLAVADAFCYDRLVLATTTYNAGLFPFMNTFLEHLTERNFQRRRVGLVENGTWAPMAAKLMKAAFEKSKDIVFAENTVTIKSALNGESSAQLLALAEELSAE